MYASNRPDWLELKKKIPKHILGNLIFSSWTHQTGFRLLKKCRARYSAIFEPDIRLFLSLIFGYFWAWYSKLKPDIRLFRAWFRLSLIFGYFWAWLKLILCLSLIFGYFESWLRLMLSLNLIFKIEFGAWYSAIFERDWALSLIFSYFWALLSLVLFEHEPDIVFEPDIWLFFSLIFKTEFWARYSPIF